ncbi:hypothetical protein, partial [Streptomyces sp. 8L]|uniref:hypothetical protein n=1 Tax=Streptomyces sp. 8L TaxID=2877242 RepID=UPI0035A8A1B8|nr:hypothetical protein [Streptomyces sp. 8L]
MTLADPTKRSTRKEVVLSEDRTRYQAFGNKHTKSDGPHAWRRWGCAMTQVPEGEHLEVRETFKLASEFAPHVTVTEETFFSHGWQPLTISVLQSLWFLPADASFDIPFLVDWYGRLGWKGANGKPLGAPVVRREIGLIREAGYVTMSRLRGEGGQAVGIQYAVSQRRIDQPEGGPWLPAIPGGSQTSRSRHVWPLPTHGRSPHVGNGKQASSDHVLPLPTPGESPHVADGSKEQVAPHVANGVWPPPPPPGGRYYKNP